MPLLFLHIPKTAGTSLDTGWLQQHFSRDERFCETDQFENGVLKSRHVFAEMEHISKHFNFKYRDVFGFYAQQGQVPLDRDYYAGHICFGIHRLFPRPSRYLTLLRDPVRRIISYYNLLHSLGNFSGTLDDFVHSGRYEVDNYEVRCLCDQGWVARSVDAAMLEEAQHNLQKHCLFGLTENLPAAIELFARSLGIPAPEDTPRLNLTREATPIHCGEGKQFKDVIVSPPESVVRELEDRNRHSVALVEFAKQHMDQQSWTGTIRRDIGW